MPFVSIPNGVRIVHVGIVSGQQCLMTFGAENQGQGIGGSGLDDIGNRHADAWRQHIVPILAAQYEHQQTLVYSLENQTTPAATGVSTKPAKANTFTSPAPLQVAAVVTHQTAKRGRSYTGRTFIGGLPGSAMQGDGRTLAPAFITSLQTAVDAYKAQVDPNLQEGGGRLAVCSKGSPAKGTPPQVTPVTRLLVRTVIGTQRRRLR